MRKVLTIIVMLFYLTAALAQVERPDTLKLPVEHGQNPVAPFTATPEQRPTAAKSMEEIKHGDEYRLRLGRGQQDEADLRLQTEPVSPVLGRWQGVTFTGSRADIDYPGMMHVQSGYLGLDYSGCGFDLSTQLMANKYLTTGLTTQLGISGQLTFHINDYTSLTAFGSYFNKSPYFYMGSYPFVSTSAYGGYLTWWNGTVGIDAGMQRRYDPFRGGWRMEPIVTPKFKLNRKVTVELPVGPLMRSLFEHRSSRRRDGPTIMPDMGM